MKSLFFIFIFHTVASVERRFDCLPEVGQATKEECLKRSCIWEDQGPEAKLNAPKCFYNSSSPPGFKVSSIREDRKSEVTLELTTDHKTFSEAYKSPAVTFQVQTKTRLRIKFFDKAKARYEVPIDKALSSNVTESDWIINRPRSKGEIFEFSVGRRVKQPSGEYRNTTIWRSTSALILTDQFMEMSADLASTHLYGIGEHSRSTFRRNLSTWKTLGLFSRDAAPYPFHNVNLYGVHPFYLMMENDGSAHGVLLLNSNAMDITVQPYPSITYRTIGGILDFYIFMGPTPEQVIQQYTEFIGRPVLPAYWSLGFQLCRYGYNSLDEVKRTVQRMQKYKIPQDVQYGDIDYMDRQRDFTYNNKTYAGLPDFVRELKKQGIKYITILDPAITAEEIEGTYKTFDLGSQLDIWIRDETGDTPLFGKVWPDKPGVQDNASWPWDERTEHFRANATFPDWFNKNITLWWNVLIKEFHKTIAFDGLWIDMNEPANFVHGSVDGCPNNTYENPPYRPKLQGYSLSDKTLCMSAKHADGEVEYNYHSLFGWKQSVVTRNALSETVGKRGIVISRSTFPSSGKYAGHWLGDNKSAWPQMHESIIGMMDFSLFGISYSGADICGFNENTTYALCKRWMQLGAFYPMSRNHNGLGFMAQDPAVFDAAFVESAREVLHLRYRFLPYLYTLMFKAHTHGDTVVRPMFHNYPKDKNTWDIDTQFFWGRDLLITPVLTEGYTSAMAYFPPEDFWYDYHLGKRMEESNKKVNVSIGEDEIKLYLRGGSIVPLQEPAQNTMLSRKNAMALLVTLDKHGEADGELIWDDGEALDTITEKKYLHLKFKAKEGKLKIQVEHNGYKDSLYFHQITIHNLEYKKPKVMKGLRLNINENHEVSYGGSGTGGKSSNNKPTSLLLVIYIFLLYISF